MHAGGAAGARGFAAGPDGAAAGRIGAEGSITHLPDGATVARGAVGGEGAVVGPGGAAAGRAGAAGIAVKGPGGQVYAAGVAGGRGVAVGAGGIAAGGFAAGGRAIGTGGFHNFSPTYYHGWANGTRAWFNGAGIFTPGWAAGHAWGWRPWGWNNAAWAAAAWTTATWATVGSMMAFDSPAPIYYDYGNNITYQGDNVYYGSQPIATQAEYYQQATQLASSSANVQDSQDVKWMPLGVFGLVAPDQKQPEMIFQLAVNKDGVIRGNYYDQAADKNMPVQGSVDKQTQRAAWQVGDNKQIVVETGLYNLTKDESTAIVHFSADKTVQYLLVRVNKDSSGSDATKSDAPKSDAPAKT
jgi:hypothetical protein